MSEEANKQLVRQHYEDLVNQNNLAAADEQMAEDFVDHGALPGVVSRGPESARQAMAALHAAVPDVHVTLDEVIAEGDLVAVRGPSVAKGERTLAMFDALSPLRGFSTSSLGLLSHNSRYGLQSFAHFVGC